jgi:hypothetical protein
MRMVNPWPSSQVRGTRQRGRQRVPVRYENGILIMATDAGDRYSIEPI